MPRSTACSPPMARMPAICRTCTSRKAATLTIEVLNAAITLEKGKPNSVFDADGSALIVHAGSDDYKTDPTGEAGGRIACGVVQ